MFEANENYSSWFSFLIYLFIYEILSCFKPIIHSYIVFVFGSKDTGEAMYHSTKEIRDSIGALKQDNISYMKRYIKNENQEE